jgi:hypothetical protein
MAGRHHQYHEPVILDGGNNPVIADAVAPEPLAITGQRVTEAARVLTAGDTSRK